MRPANSAPAAKRSSSREHTCENGMISRGKYVFVTMFRYATRLIVPEFTLFRKKNHGTSPLYAKIGYGTPSPEMLPSRENTNVNTAIVASGWMIAQPNPKSDWL